MRTEWEREYLNTPINPKEIEIQCDRCGMWLGEPPDSLPVHYDIEQSHPLNRGKGVNHPNLHVTKFSQCPCCKRNLYADGKALRPNGLNTRWRDTP